MDADGSVDYGCIDHLSQACLGEYRIAREFGDVSVAAGVVSLALGAAAQQFIQTEPASRVGLTQVLGACSS